MSQTPPNQKNKVSIPPLLTNDVPVNDSHIIGRAAELAEMRDHLAQNRPTVLVNGIGGIGKTTVATKYMVQYAHEYAHRAWITVQSSLLETFVNHTTLLSALGITEEVQRLLSAQQPAAALDCVLLHLNKLNRTLIVIDNANDLTDLVEHKHFFDALHCHCLITSRNSPPEWTVVAIEHLPTHEAVQLFKRMTPSPKGVIETVKATDETIKTLLSKLYFHTLLIELVAKAIHSAGLSFAEAQAMIEERFIHHQELNEELIATGKHGDSLPENTKRANIEDYIWHIFKNVQGLSDTDKDILRGIALLPLGYVIERKALKEHLAHFGIKEDVVRHLTLLVERGWLELERTEAGKPAYKMHPLIADVVKKHLALDVAFAEAYIKHVAALINYSNTNPKHNLFDINQNRPLAERLSDLFFDKDTDGVSYLLDRLGYLEENFGVYQKAAHYKERALQIAEVIFDKNHETIAVRQNNLALVYKDLGKYDQAAELLEIVLVSTVENLGKDYAYVAVYQSNLAMVYQSLGKYNRASELLEAALDSELKNFGDEHPNVARCQSNLALVYQGLGKYDRAAELLEAALVSDLKSFGQEHPNVARCQSNLATVYQSLGRYEQAAELLELALASDLKNFGHEHSRVSTMQSNLAMVYRDLGKYDRAAELLEAALASDLKNFGQEHPSVAIRQFNLAGVYINMDKKPEAKVLLQAAYQNFLNNLGAEHPHTKAVQLWFPYVE